ncbi:hypothetical protein GALL_512240 [mine drainage metagenome]|uniref:Uncharacterized protein n=1 Tax=mine drainage metagenome TaxID=410659 RepID=A0A1J5PHC3_9ZZZZ
MRRGAVAAFAGDIDPSGIDGRHQWPRRGVKRPERQVWRVMDAIDLIDAEPLHHAFLHHDLTAATVFLCRLKDQRDTAGKAARFSQIFRGPQQHRGMPVMATRVHLTGVLRGILRPRRLGNRQRVHIGAQPDGATRPLPVDDRHDAGLGDALMDFVHANLAQAGRDERGGLRQFKRQLGVLMQMATPPFHFLGIIGDAVDDGHGGLPCFIFG